MLGKCTIYPWHAVMGTDLGIGNSFHPTKESIHLRVGFACFFSHSCGFFRVKLHGSNWWQNEFPSKTWRCCWCWDVVGAFLLLVLKLKHQMVWKNSNVHILYHIVILTSPKDLSSLNAKKAFSNQVRSSSAFWRRCVAAFARYLLSTHGVIMWRYPQSMRRELGRGRKHWVFPCGMSCPVKFVIFWCLGAKKHLPAFWKHSPSHCAGFFHCTI